MFDGVYTGLLAVLAWDSVIMMIVGVIIGMVLGAIPGISGTLGVALAIPFTYGMSPLAALGLLAGIHNGASQGGAIPAILLRIPGTPGSICTSWDGYPLAQQGHAGAAIQLSAISSSVGGVLSAVSLILLAPPLARAALAIDGAIRRHGRGLADRQLEVGGLSARVRDLASVLAVAHHADASGDEAAVAAADVWGRLALARAGGRSPGPDDFAALAALGAAATGGSLSR